MLADDHPFVLLGIRAALERDASIKVVGTASTPSELLDMLHSTPCDVLVTDLAMPDPDSIHEDGLRLIRRIRREWPQLGVVVLTSLTNGVILHSLVTDQAISVVNKAESMEDVAVAVRLAVQGEAHVGDTIAGALSNAGAEAFKSANLSPRETEVVRLFAGGHSLTEIARMLDRDVRTVSRQKRDAMVKLGIHNDPGLFAFAHAHGLI
ncbi:response regulator transcription factor [Trinickia violacea]|uniref:Response regulator transcription factor n=1 Tax=Trinickia violacea TaxID=2571746 RepID=A0A4P8ITC8_9BURK|nr:response regulator transcription factor [Trinickia violacea]